MKKYYTLCLLLFGLSAFAFELSEPIENALKAKQLKEIEQKTSGIKEVKNEVSQAKENKNSLKSSNQTQPINQ